jgi:hypothetical protein
MDDPSAPAVGGGGHDASIAAAVGRGLTGEHFDLSANLRKRDAREVDPAVWAMEAIMERDGVDFDTARLAYNQQKMREAGIDPETGLSLDPKAVTSTQDFERVFSAVDGDGGGDGGSGWLRGRALAVRRWWAAQVRAFGLGFVLFVSVSNFCFGVLYEWYAIFLAFYLKDDLGMKPAVTQSIIATAELALQLRPLCGIISDSRPLLGSTRHSWWFLSSMLAVLSQGALLLVSDVTLTTALLLSVKFFGGAWVFVISGAMIAEKARLDPEAGAENLQAIQWGWYSVGLLSGDFRYEQSLSIRAAHIGYSLPLWRALLVSRDKQHAQRWAALRGDGLLGAEVLRPLDGHLSRDGVRPVRGRGRLRHRGLSHGADSAGSQRLRAPAFLRLRRRRRRPSSGGGGR